MKQIKKQQREENAMEGTEKKEKNELTKQPPPKKAILSSDH